MANRNQRHPQQDQWHQNDRHQMGQYADQQRQYGAQDDQDSRHDARNWGARREGSDLHRHDPTQASYGRASAPDVHGGPSGGYQRDWQADPGYNRPGYMRNPSHQGYGSRDERGGRGDREGGVEQCAAGGAAPDGLVAVWGTLSRSHAIPRRSALLDDSAKTAAFAF